jgi:hypothetical protein
MIKHHFWFSVNGFRYTYVDIRKNACTTFRHFLRRTSDFRSNQRKQSDLRFLVRHHGEKDIADVKKSHQRILILRDPVERTLSLYMNKFLDRSGNEGIFRDYRAETRQNADQATINDFVYRYLKSKKDLTELNQHVWPQSAHLASVNYDATILLNDLPEAAQIIFGAEIGSKYFARKTNASGDRREIRSELTPESEAIVRARYATDCMLFEMATTAKAATNSVINQIDCTKVLAAASPGRTVARKRRGLARIFEWKARSPKLRRGS